MTPAEFTARCKALRDERDTKLAAVEKAVQGSKDKRETPPRDYWERQRETRAAYCDEVISLMAMVLFEAGYAEGVEVLGGDQVGLFDAAE